MRPILFGFACIIFNKVKLASPKDLLHIKFLLICFCPQVCVGLRLTSGFLQVLQCNRRGITVIQYYTVYCLWRERICLSYQWLWMLFIRSILTEAQTWAEFTTDIHKSLKCETWDFSEPFALVSLVSVTNPQTKLAANVIWYDKLVTLY